MNYRRAIDAVQVRLWPRTAGAEIEPITGWDFRAILIGLMVPMGMTVLNLTMFGVALPAIRDSFQIEADTVAWLVTAYTLPFVMFMPLYGRLGDGLGKRRLFSVGILVFFIGTAFCLAAENLTWLIPLYLTDIYGVSGTQIGLLITLQAGALLATVRYSGRLADLWSRRWPVMIGFAVQALVMAYFANLPPTMPLWGVAAGIGIHGAASLARPSAG